jgi:NAD(P)-dependent dehydrogenase (short-subunit alcohol dehydrogenase family)
MTKRRIVIIGASRGIGAALVEKLQQDTANEILALSRNIGELQRRFDGLDRVSVAPFDLSDKVREQASDIFSRFDSIDVLINNAGLLVNKPFEHLSHEDISTSYQVNVVGVMETVQAALPYLSSKGAHVVNISSMGGFQGTMKFAGLAAYSTSKAALCSFTELFAEEYKDSHIKMNCLCLGAAQTEMLEAAFPGYQAPVSAAEMAEFIADFALNGQRWMNGKILPVSLSTP